MSILDELKKRAGPRVRIRTASPRSSPPDGDELRRLLTRTEEGRLVDAIALAHALVDAGLSPREARRIIDELEASGDPAAVMRLLAS